MASNVKNSFKVKQANDTIELGSDNLWFSLHMSNTTFDTEIDNADLEYMDDAATSDEFDGANYVRKALANVSIAVDDANDRAELDCDDITWSSLGAGTRSIAGGMVHTDPDNDGDSADDAANEVIAWNEFSATPDGNDFQLTINAEGLLQLA